MKPLDENNKNNVFSPKFFEMLNAILTSTREPIYFNDVAYTEGLELEKSFKQWLCSSADKRIHFLSFDLKLFYNLSLRGVSYDQTSGLSLIKDYDALCYVTSSLICYPCSVIVIIDMVQAIEFLALINNLAKREAAAQSMEDEDLFLFFDPQTLETYDFSDSPEDLLEVKSIPDYF